MKHILVLLFCFSSLSLFAQSYNLQTKNSVNAFIPKGWKQIYSAKGDLNKDNLADEVIIIQNTDPKNIIKNIGLGGQKLNVNPRTILVLFKTSKGYQLKAKNSHFIPTENDTVTTCLADPLQETGAINIKNGALILSYHYWLSCGSYEVSNEDYTFRFQNQKFELIGYDYNNFSRSTGEEMMTSVNFSTHKKSETSGGNMFDDKTNKPKTVWKKFTWNKLFTLDEMTEELAEKLSAL